MQRTHLRVPHDRARAFYEREGWSVDPTLTSEATDIARVVYYRRALRPPS